MMHKLAKMLEHKKVRPLDDDEKEAKMGVLGSLKDYAEQEMAHPLRKMKEVKVAASSQEGLKAGLDKAREMAGKEDPEQGMEIPEETDESEHMATETDEEEKAEDHEDSDHMDDIHDGMDDAEIDAKLSHLMALKAKRSKG